ncbi:MAG: NUDIX domain-containing protein [Gemmatimonadaceae bacterium]
MTELRLGVVDVLVIRPSDDGWRVLLLRRSGHARCPGAWEMVHGSIEPGERPAAAALRELREETGLAAERLYNVTVHAFHLHQNDTVQVAVAFCAFVAAAGGPADAPDVSLGGEHDHHEWLSVPEAAERFFWPQERRVLLDAHRLLRDGNAGPAEDVLRVI